jgi:hypothetical protein
MTKHREILLEMVSEGTLCPNAAVEMMCQWLSEDDVRDMLDANELSERFMESVDG